MDQPPKKARRGCLFYGGIVLAVLCLALLIAGYMGYRYARHLIEEYTDTAPVTLPVVQMSADNIKQTRERIDSFFKAVDAGKATGPLTITTDEANALIQNDTELGMKGQVYVTLEEDRVNAQVSIPVERLGLRMLQGRYFNGTGSFSVSFENGTLRVSPESLSTKGRPLPENVMRNLRAQNLAEKYENRPDVRPTLEKLQSIKIADGKITIVPKGQ